MYGSDSFGAALVALIIICIGAAFSVYFLIDWLFISDDLITRAPLVPEVRETCINGVCDTVYIYKNIK